MSNRNIIGSYLIDEASCLLEETSWDGTWRSKSREAEEQPDKLSALMIQFYRAIQTTYRNWDCHKHKRKTTQSETEESEEEQPKKRKVFNKNHVYHVSEWIPDTDSVSGEAAEGAPFPSNY